MNSPRGIGAQIRAIAEPGPQSGQIRHRTGWGSPNDRVDAMLSTCEQADRFPDGGPQEHHRMRCGHPRHFCGPVRTFLLSATITSDSEDIRRLTASLSARIPADARVATTEVGAIAFYSQWYIIDLVGLVDRKSLDCLKVHGRPDTGDQLDEMLYHQGASHYVNTIPGDADNVPIDRPYTRLSPLGRATLPGIFLIPVATQREPMGHLRDKIPLRQPGKPVRLSPGQPNSVNWRPTPVLLQRELRRARLGVSRAPL